LLVLLVGWVLILGLCLLVLLVRWVLILGRGLLVLLVRWVLILGLCLLLLLVGWVLITFSVAGQPFILRSVGTVLHTVETIYELF